MEEDIRAAIIAAHRAIACEHAARIDPAEAGIWMQVAAREHRKKRLALARIEHTWRAPTRQGLDSD
jgi:hypothetical protein